MRFLKVSLIVGVCIVCLVGVASAAVVDRIAAVVNNDIITLSEVNRNFDAYVKRLKNAAEIVDSEQAREKIKKLLLDTLIDQKIVLQEATKLGLLATDAQVDETINDMLTKKKITRDELHLSIMKEGGTLDEYKEEVRQHLTKMRLVAREIRSKVAVRDEEIGEYYSRHRKDYEGAEAVRMAQVLLIIPPNCDEDEKEKVHQKALTIRERIHRGESFRLMAMQYSQGPAAKVGGDLGYMEKGLMLPEVDRAAFSLKIHELSDVVESSIGFHIITITDKRGEGVKPINSVREEIVGNISEEKIEKKFHEWLDKKRRQSHIDIRL